MASGTLSPPGSDHRDAGAERGAERVCDARAALRGRRSHRPAPALYSVWQRTIGALHPAPEGSPMPTRIATTQAPAAVGPYSQGVSASDAPGSLVFVSGQVPLDPATGALVDGGIAAQAERSLRNVGAILAEAGLGYEHVVKTTVLLADIADFAVVNEVYARYFTGEVLPARAAFAVAALPLGARVEIEAIAVRP